MSSNPHASRRSIAGNFGFCNSIAVPFDSPAETVRVIHDLAILSASWQQPATNRAQDEFNNDGIVNLLDGGLLSLTVVKKISK